MIRILVVEDSATQAAELRIILESAGYEVETATDGMRGVQTFATSRFDLVISDIVMPGLSGYDVCRAIHERPEGRDTPVILVTALSDPHDVVRALACGANNFITKPYQADHLLARVARVLEHHVARAGGRPCDEVRFLGETFIIDAKREQILDLLVDTFEDVVRTNQALQARQAELMQVQQQKEELASLIVHDLKNPLNAMFLLTRLLSQEKGLSEDGRDGVRQLRNSCETMRRLIMNLLDISRSEDGQLVPQIVDVDLGHLLAEVVDSMTFRAEQRKQRLLMRSFVDAPVIRADGDLLRRLLENLVDNAQKYAPAESMVTLEVHPSGDRHLELRVCDAGLGVLPEDRERIFDKYVRLEPGQHQRTSRGLGLVFCRLAAEAHEGRIWVQPNQPTGSSFCVRLPIAGPAAARTVDAQATAASFSQVLAGARP